MNSRKETQDITELLFSLKDLSEEDLRQQEIYSRATKEAAKLVGTTSPMVLLRKTEELYKKYIEETK